MKAQRSQRQNRAMHLWFRMLADELNGAGLDQRKVLKPSVSIPWTQQAVKEHLWRPIQKAMYAKLSTTELAKADEVTGVYEVLSRHLAERFGLDIPTWPHFERPGEYEKITASTSS